MRQLTTLAAAVGVTALIMVPATAAEAANGYVHLQAYSGTTLLGGVIFNGNGETVTVCDDYSDGNYVHGFITWNGVTYEVTDTNGHASGCGTANYSIAENTPVSVILCVDIYTPCYEQDTTA